MKPLSSRERADFGSFTSSNPNVANAFAKYKPKPIDFVVNLAFGCPQDLSTLQVRQHIVPHFTTLLNRGALLDELLVVLEKSSLHQYQGLFPLNLTLQFVSHDHEVEGKDFVFRGLKMLPH